MHTISLSLVCYPEPHEYENSRGLVNLAVQNASIFSSHPKTCETVDTLNFRIVLLPY